MSLLMVHLLWVESFVLLKIEGPIAVSSRPFSREVDTPTFTTALSFAALDLLKREVVRDWMEENEAQPTIIALTDGFNNEKADDVCSDNANRLQRLVQTIRRVRNDPEVDIRYRPLIYTVGLGTPILPRFRLPRENRAEVSSGRLCSRNREVLIDGNLENRGIDNASLSWIADVEREFFCEAICEGAGRSLHPGRRQALPLV